MDTLITLKKWLVDPSTSVFKIYATDTFLIDVVISLIREEYSINYNKVAVAYFTIQSSRFN